MPISLSLRGLAPDVAATLRRFPLPVLLIAAATAVLLALINDWVSDWNDTWTRLLIGLATAAIVAVAGSLFGESRPERRWLTLLLAVALPLAVVAAFQVRGERWLALPLWPGIAVLWLSVAAFTRIERGAARELAQDRFWWLNHRAVATACIATVGFVVIALGLWIIEQSLDLLLGISIGDLFYRYLLPTVGGFCVPLYWLSTLPRLESFRADELERPDFLSQAIGFLGQFVLAPLLVAYAAILLVYSGQILVLWELPQGTVGWLVLGFVIVGAATWLVLHPRFMRARSVVRLFRRVWFWLTLVPLALYALAVWVRIDAYGLTPSRALLVAAGVWAAVLTAAFLSRRFADIRLIPGLALLLLGMLAVGPWNQYGLAAWSQASRLDAALAEARQPDGAFRWDEASAARVRGAIQYLDWSDERDRLRAVLARHGVAATEDQWFVDLFEALHLPRDEHGYLTRTYRMIQRDGTPVDLGAARLLLGGVSVYPSGWSTVGPLSLQIDPAAGAVLVRHADGVPVALDLSAWLDRQDGETATEPRLPFEVNGRGYLLVINLLTLEGETVSGGPLTASYLDGLLFADSPP